MGQSHSSSPCSISRILETPNETQSRLVAVLGGQDYWRRFMSSATCKLLRVLDRNPDEEWTIWPSLYHSSTSEQWVSTTLWAVTKRVSSTLSSTIVNQLQDPTVLWPRCYRNESSPLSKSAGKPLNHGRVEVAVDSPTCLAGRLPKEPSKTMIEVQDEQSWYFFQHGQPILSALCHLSVEDVEGALHKLWMGNELELIMALRIALGLGRDTVVDHQLARKCEASGRVNKPKHCCGSLCITIMHAKRQLDKARWSVVDLGHPAQVHGGQQGSSYKTFQTDTRG